MIQSVWRYEAMGQNWVGQEARLITRKSEFNAIITCTNGADAWTLFCHLRFKHFNAHPFAIPATAMARDEDIPGWTNHKRYLGARDALLEIQIIKQVYQGGRGGTGGSDPSLFCFVHTVPLRDTL